MMRPSLQQRGGRHTHTATVGGRRSAAATQLATGSRQHSSRRAVEWRHAATAAPQALASNKKGAGTFSMTSGSGTSTAAA